MQTLVINVDDDINVIDIYEQLKKLSPSLHIVKSITNTSHSKKFTGIGDLKSLHVNDFKVYQREELYDR